ncbi:MAG TPA: glycosyltransferase family 2 protein [Gemmatimonadaceae bacterium]|nr:glycosyltransferase family 2 protein [Gemmatimonadaceae bacterium]
MTSSPPTVGLSVVVPLYNEVENVRPLVTAVRDALTDWGSPWELVLVDDGSTDATVDAVREAARGDARIRLVQLARNYGQTQAMQAGFDAARGSVVVSMDGDLQNDPRDIPRLVAELDQGYDLVAGYRVRRQDRVLTRKVPSWVANRIIAWLTGVRIRDNGCSLKAYRRWLLQEMRLYSDMHRFLPALAAATARSRITEIPVRHHPRRFGTSKYGLSRIAKLLADLITIKMISSFRDRPLALFGTAALGAMLVAAGVGAYWATALYRYGVAVAGTYVLPAAALLWLLLAAYLVMLGLVGEVILRKSNEDRGARLARA